MVKILKNEEIAPNIFEMVLEAPKVAKVAKPGQFAIAMASENGERIPLTLADWNTKEGTVTLVVMAIGHSSRKIVALKEGESLYALMAPLGEPSTIEKKKHVILVAGGVGIAPVYPIAKALYNIADKVTIIQGARSKDLLFWGEKSRKVCHEYFAATDDGSVGHQGFVTDVLKQTLKASESVDEVYAIGPVMMMKACSEVTKPFNVLTIVSLNTIMIDGTGMCGGCRVNVGNETKFTCVDGPEFDGHLVDWENLTQRQKAYGSHEKCALEKIKVNI